MNPFRFMLNLSALFSSLFLCRLFKHFGKNSKLISPLKIDGFRNIYIGDQVTIGYKSWLAAVGSSTLVISNGSRIGSFNEIYATDRIEIGENVLTADNVYICDNTHDYEDIKTPILGQPTINKGSVKIGSGAWLGRNVVVIGASIGKNSVIGANSVVLSDVPDFCVAVGSPAKVIKRYDQKSSLWLKL